MQPLEDLGAKFIRNRSFNFDHIIIHEIIFDESNDVTLFCTVPYFGENYSANFGLTFDQLNIILRNTSEAGKDIAAAIADELKSGIEIPSVIEVDLVYGQPLEVVNCIFYTVLFDFTEDEEEELDDDDDDIDDDDDNIIDLSGLKDDDKDADDEPKLTDIFNENLIEDDDEDEDDDDDGVAFAFLIEDIKLKVTPP